MSREGPKFNLDGQHLGPEAGQILVGGGDVLTGALDEVQDSSSFQWVRNEDTDLGHDVGLYRRTVLELLLTILETLEGEEEDEEPEDRRAPRR